MGEKAQVRHKSVEMSEWNQSHFCLVPNLMTHCSATVSCTQYTDHLISFFFFQWVRKFVVRTPERLFFVQSCFFLDERSTNHLSIGFSFLSDLSSRCISIITRTIWNMSKILLPHYLLNDNIDARYPKFHCCRVVLLLGARCLFWGVLYCN